MDNEKYETLLSELAEVLKQKNKTIDYQRLEIERLKKKIEDVENAALNAAVKLSGKAHNIEKR